MPRCGRIRSYIQEIAESPRTEQLSFIIPFFVLVLEIILLYHAVITNEYEIIMLTLILLIVSIIETMFVSLEIHERYQESNFQRLLTIRLDDFILEQKSSRNVKLIVEDFLERYPIYHGQRTQIYHIACQIMETHKEEAFEKELTQKLTIYVNRRKTNTVDELLSSFLKKYPKYKPYRADIYQKICQLKTPKKN